MGEEFAACSPFLYFTDHEPELGRLVTEGRRREFAGFSAFADPARREQIPDPQAESTYRRSQLDHAERERNAPFYNLYRELLRLRGGDAVFARPDRTRTAATALGETCVVVRRWSENARRMLIANFGDELALSVDDPAFGGWLPTASSPLLSTAAPRFGGDGRRIRRAADQLIVPTAFAAVWKVDGVSDSG